MVEGREVEFKCCLQAPQEAATNTLPSVDESRRIPAAGCREVRWRAVARVFTSAVRSKAPLKRTKTGGFM